MTRPIPSTSSSSLSFLSNIFLFSFTSSASRSRQDQKKKRVRRRHCHSLAVNIVVSLLGHLHYKGLSTLMGRPKQKNIRPDVPTRASKRRLIVSEEEDDESQQELANLIEQVTAEAAAGASLAAAGQSLSPAAQISTAAGSSPSAAADGPSSTGVTTTAAGLSTSTAAPSHTAGEASPSAAAPSHTAGEVSPSATAPSHTTGEASPSAAAQSHTTGEASPSVAVSSHIAGENSPSAPADTPIVAADSPSAAADTPTVVTFRYADYGFETPGFFIRGESGDLGVKSEIGKFSDFKKILVDQELDSFFRSTVFGKYLDIGEGNTPRFQMTLMYNLLRRWIKSENDFWVNFCGMPVCFDMKEFAVVTGLNCHLPPPPASKSAKVDRRYKRIVDAMGKKHCKTKEMVDLLQSSDVKKSVKKSLCLVFFVHNILMGKDPGTNAMDSWFKLSADRKAFCAYPWGRDSYVLTVKYLRKAATSIKKSANLYGFSWAFMGWAFEAIPHIRKTFNEFNEEVSSPRLLRWLAAPNNIKVEAHELLDPPEDEIVYPWLIPTESEKEMDFWKGFVPLEEKEEDPSILKLVKDLAGVTAIKRDLHVDVGDGVGVDAGVGVGVGDVVDAGAGVGDAARTGVGDAAGAGIDVAGVAADETAVREAATVGYRGGFSPLGGGDFGTPLTVGRSGHVGAGTSKVPCGTCGCEICNDKMNKMMEKIESFERTLNTVMSKRGVIPSSRVVSPYTPIRVQRRRRQVSKALMSARKRATAATMEQQTPAVREEQEAAAVREEQQPTDGTEEQQPAHGTGKQQLIG